MVNSKRGFHMKLPEMKERQDEHCLSEITCCKALSVFLARPDKLLSFNLQPGLNKGCLFVCLSACLPVCLSVCQPGFQGVKEYVQLQI